MQRLLHKRIRCEDGMSLIEVLIAIVVLLIVLVPASLLLTTSFRYAASDRRSVQAASIAMTEISELTHGSFNTIASLSTCSPTLGNGTPVATVTEESILFSVWGCAEWRNSTGSGDLCSATGSPGVLLVEVRVTWPNMKRPPVVDATLANPPVGTISATKGFLAVNVTGASNQPISGVTVNVTGPNGYSQEASTPADGCAYFLNLTPGVYNATISKPGYVSDQEVISPAQSTNVTTASTSVLDFSYDLGTTFSLKYTAPSLGSLAGQVATNLPVSVGNTNLQPSGWYGAGPPPSAPLSTPSQLGPLYPYNSGYTVWGGNCASNVPPASMQGSSIMPTISVTSGKTENADVFLVPLYIVVSTAGGIPANGVSIQATDHSSGCTENFGLMTTNVKGQSLTAVPLAYPLTSTQPGQYTITLTGPGPGHLVTTVDIEVSEQLAGNGTWQTEVTDLTNGQIYTYPAPVPVGVP